jgi:hypothetical protein
MENTNKKGRDGWTRATQKTSAACNFNPLSRTWCIARHVLITLPFECAMLVICFIVLVGVML